MSHFLPGIWQTIVWCLERRFFLLNGWVCSFTKWTTSTWARLLGTQWKWKLPDLWRMLPCVQDSILGHKAETLHIFLWLILAHDLSQNVPISVFFEAHIKPAAPKCVQFMYKESSISSISATFWIPKLATQCFLSVVSFRDIDHVHDLLFQNNTRQTGATKWLTKWQNYTLTVIPFSYPIQSHTINSHKVLISNG